MAFSEPLTFGSGDVEAVESGGGGMTGMTGALMAGSGVAAGGGGGGMTGAVIEGVVAGGGGMAGTAAGDECRAGWLSPKLGA